MARITVSCNDGFLFAALCYSIVILIIKWSKYSECDYPLQLFLIIDYLTVILFRCSHFFMQFVFENHRLRRFALFLKVGVIYVFFVIWTIVGTVWFNKTGRCLPENNQYWTFVVWLILSYVWIALYACLLGVQYYISHNHHQFNNWAHQVNFPLHLINPPEAVGLTPTQISSIGSNTATEEDVMKTCSICLDQFTIGENIRQLPNCGHIFHVDEIDTWIARKNSCPNCRVAVILPGGNPDGGDGDVVFPVDAGNGGYGGVGGGDNGDGGDGGDGDGGDGDGVDGVNRPVRPNGRSNPSDSLIV